MTDSTDVLHLDDYGFDGLEDLASPTLLVYEAFVEENLDRMRRELEGVVPGSGLRHLRTHVKTHKSSWTTGIQLRKGVARFKCSPHELDMLLEAGARDVFVAYPPLRPLAETIAERVVRFPDASISSQIASTEHAGHLAAAAAARDVRIDVYVDLDIGGHRTGLPPEEAPALLREITSNDAFERLNIVGLHAYDGHNTAPDPAARRACSRETMQRVVTAMGEIERDGTPIPRICAGGSPGFLPCLEELVGRHCVDADVDVSPGTFIYWDTKYDGLMPGRFRIAALILARVMDRCSANQVTLDLGHKRWAIDQGPVERFSVPNAEVIGTTEEHTILQHDGTQRFEIGDPVLIAPRHVCPTVNLWESFLRVDRDGRLHQEPLAVTARNR
jgi:D-serine deaminase-like pyridoxal phosphate-dependent protein